MYRAAVILVMYCAVPIAAEAQVFDRQFAGAEQFNSDDGDDQKQRAFRVFVGRHAFATSALPVVGFFGCNGDGGGECNRGPSLTKAGQTGRQGGTSSGSSDTGDDSAADSGGSCP